MGVICSVNVWFWKTNIRERHLSGYEPYHLPAGIISSFVARRSLCLQLQYKNSAMTIKNILQQLESSAHPVARSLHKGADFNLLVIGFKKGMRLQEHRAGKVSKLTVIQGSVVYEQGSERTVLHQFDEQDIPVQVTHAVEALEDSVCLLSQG
jgi:quercetin dioxygenase-like cupin family protein